MGGSVLEGGMRRGREVDVRGCADSVVVDSL